MIKRSSKSCLFSLCFLLLGGIRIYAQENPNPRPDPQQIYYDAVKARMLGDNKQSEVLLKKVVQLIPNEAAPYYDLSQLAFKANDPNRAAEYITKAIELDGSNKWYHEQYANVLALMNNNVGAADEYAKIARTEKYNENYLEKSALLYQRAGKFQEALNQLALLEKKNKDDDDVLLKEQQVYLKMNDVEAAAAVSRRLIDRNPKESRYYSLLIEIYESNKLPEKAKGVIAEMQQKFPSDPSLQLELASQALKKGDTLGYRKYVRKSIINKDLDAQTQLQLLGPYLGALSSDSSQRHEALELIQQISAQHPENIDVIMAYGRILSFNNQQAQANEQFKKVISINPNNYTAWEQLLYAYTARPDADSLIRWSEKAAKLFPNQAQVHFLNGVGHYNKKDYNTAIQALNRALDLEPDEKLDERSRIHTTLGDIYNTLKDYKHSDSNYDSALKLNPKNETVLNNYAYYLSVRNTRLEDAARMSKESLKIRPGESTFLDTYGWILYQQGKYPEALDYIQQAVSKIQEDTDPTLYEHLGAALFKMGDINGAVAAWKKAKEKGSENVNIDKMISERKLYE